MRSITFDESTVLREYARIMGEQLIKTAASDKPASKVYDVTGESGEDLVDDAHPGNMHTEISNRKDDDGNLVETIVERQEMDLDVVRKVPKGTYATLVELYNRLHKAGQVEVLSDLANVIKSIATAEDIMEHTLVTLANVLDEKGFTKAANIVDALLKTAFGELFPAVSAIKQLITDLQAQNTGDTFKSLYQKMSAELDTVKDQQGLYEYVKRYNAVLAKHKDYPKALIFIQKFISKTSSSEGSLLVTLANALDERGFVAAADKVDELVRLADFDYYNRMNEQSKQSPTVLAPGESVYPTGPRSTMQTPTWPPTPAGSQTPASGIAGVAPAPVAPVARPLGKGGTVAVQKWQQQYNATHKDKLIDDGIWGANTQKAYESVQTRPVTNPIAPDIREHLDLDTSDRLDQKLDQNRAPTAVMSGPAQARPNQTGWTPNQHK